MRYRTRKNCLHQPHLFPVIKLKLKKQKQKITTAQNIIYNRFKLLTYFFFFHTTGVIRDCIFLLESKKKCVLGG
jgi:hypothetical protein